MTNKQLEKLGKSINKEVKGYRKDKIASKEKTRALIEGMKDTIYKIGVIIDEEKYSFGIGFDKFCKKLNIDWVGGYQDENKKI